MCVEKLGSHISLWVHALCIIQDCGSHKLDPITQMGTIYKTSTIIIVAASAGEATNDFVDRKPDEPFAQLPIFVDSSKSGTVYLRIQDAETAPAKRAFKTVNELDIYDRA